VDSQAIMEAILKLTKAQVSIGAGLGCTGAPPGTRTPNPRIRSPNPVMSSYSGLCRPVPFPQASDEPLCRPVPAQAGYLAGHRAPMEHRDGPWCSIDRQGGERWDGRTSGLSIRCFHLDARLPAHDAAPVDRDAADPDRCTTG
jgi:hypothetical protein